MVKLTSYEKLSKKEKKKRDKMKRGSWFGVNPVTRRPENSKAYSRRKAQDWKKDSGLAFFVMRIYNSFTYRPFPPRGQGGILAVR